MKNICNNSLNGNQRHGDVRHSLADVSALKKQLNFTPTVTMEEGLRYIAWAKTELWQTR
jgi:nucleoside-diphosphate-sugar epimerase